MASFALLVLATFAACAGQSTEAASLTQVRDLITTSAINAQASHAIDFTVTNAVPASGKIVITPQSNSVTIPALFDFTDVDMLVASAHRTLASTTSATSDGVSVTPGTVGSITITLNSTTGIPAGTAVRIILGTLASSGAIGDQTLQNAGSLGSYRVAIATRNASNAAIDSASAMFQLVRQVSTSVYTQNIAPILSSGLPSGLIASGNAVIELSLQTNEPATCRYSTTANTPYSSMSSATTFRTISGVVQYLPVSGHVNSTTYTYYVRCTDSLSEVTIVDFPISFSLDATPISQSSIPIGGVTGTGGVGNFPEGSSFLYRSNVTLSGYAPAGSSVFVLKDGKQEASSAALSDGRFSIEVKDLERGTYTFVTYATDSKGRRTASFPSTIALGQGTINTISNIVLSPSVALEKEQVALNEDVRAFGESVPGSTVEVYVSKTGTTADAKKFTATTTKGVQGLPDGSYSVTFNAKQFPLGTYDIRAKAIVSSGLSSGLSNPVALGVGEKPVPRSGLRSDLNKDGKVNLTDFSILLSFWRTADAIADINEDKDVNLADFSIMLFDWTG